MVLSFLFKKIMDNISEIFVKVGLDQFFKNSIENSDWKNSPPKIRKKLKIYEKWDFYIIRKAITLSAYWYNFYDTFIFGLKIIVNVSVKFVSKLGSTSFLKIWSKI